MKPAISRRQLSPSEAAQALRNKVVAHELAVKGFDRFMGDLPRHGRVRQLACEKFASLLAAQAREDRGVVAVHSMLSGAALAGDPAHRGEDRGSADLEAVFGKGGGQ